MGDDEGRQFTSDPADYNRVVCMVCRARIKVTVSQSSLY